MFRRTLVGLCTMCVFSMPMAARAATSLPAPWSSQDVGTTGPSGSASFANGQFGVTGAGADIWGTADAFQFVSQAVAGDAQIVARVTSLGGGNTFAKAGVMFRDTVAAGSADVLLDVRPDGSIEFMARRATGAATTFIAGGTQRFPAWLRLTRHGTTFTGDISPDGATWTRVATASVVLTANLPDVGLVVTSHNAAQAIAATFDNVAVTSVTGPSLPAPWSSQDVGTTGRAGSASFPNGQFSVTGAGADIWGTVDAFQFVSQAVAGDAQIVARVASFQGGNTFAKAGVMFRDTVAAGSADVLLDVRPNGSIEFMARTATGAATTFIAGGTQLFPAWLRLTRRGATFTGDISPDGAAWTRVGSTSVVMAAGLPDAGLVVTSHDATQLIAATFDNVSVVAAVTHPPAAPTAYNAISDRNAYGKPALPLLGQAGFAFADPTFGSNMLRVTDGQTRPGLVNRSFRIPSNAHLTAWNAASTAFYVISNDGTVIPYAFDPATRAASRIHATGTGDGGLTLAFYVEPQFSVVNANLIYGVLSGNNNRTIAQYAFDTGTYTTLLNLDTIVGGLAGTYVGGLMSGGTPAENLLAFFGGGAQDSHYYALWAPVGNPSGGKLLNTVASTLNGVPTGTVLNFHLHSAEIDRSGRFVLLYPTSVDLGSPRYASQVYVWDTASGAVTAVTSGGQDGGPAMRPYGHDATGYGTWVNQDCCTSSTWDAAQWQFRNLASLTQTTDLIAPVQASKEVYLADHTSWNNAQPTALVPVISSTYRYGNNTAPWRAWDDEIIGIDTANGGGGNVWRFAHHRSLVASDSNPAAPYFWYEPIANVSPDGQWVVFTSNWEKTLGTDSAEGTFRQDVFLVQLTPAP